MNQEEMTGAFKQALTEFHEGEKDAGGDFFIPREEHYKHHSFVKGLMEFAGITKKTAWRALVMLVMGGVATVVVTGTIAFIVLKVKGLV